MKKIILSVVFIAASFTTVAQVGIGTTAPTAALHILVDNENADGIKLENEDTVSANKYAFFGIGGPTAHSIPAWVNTTVLESATSGGLLLGTFAIDSKIKFQVQGRSIDAMVIDSNGNVGIGVPFGATSTSKLQINGLGGYATDTAAGTAGLTTGALYQTLGHATLPDGVVMIKL